jgi:hypothetical protein
MTEARSRNTGEDVLSSIRRLVAHDAPDPETPTEKPADNEIYVAKPAHQEKLLLTPSLRVDEPDETELPCDGAEPHHSSENEENLPSLISRISNATFSPDKAAGSASAEREPISEQVVQDVHSARDGGNFAQSVEDRALEATLARLQAVLAGNARASGDNAPNDGEEPLEELIDEGMLYQLVAHIVRQELQGDLGEKITRNIRKLVRAEVAREIQLRQL